MSQFGIPVLPPGEAPANGPSPLPAPSTANVALCNFTGQPATFKIYGTQGAAAVKKEIVVPAFTYVWSTGWATGGDKMLTVTTPYITKTFCPFVTSDLIALFET
jgi:hypothetical protein